MQADTSMTWRRDLAWCSSSSAEIARAIGVLDALRNQGVIDARGFVMLNGVFADAPILASSPSSPRGSLALHRRCVAIRDWRTSPVTVVVTLPAPETYATD